MDSFNPPSKSKQTYTKNKWFYSNSNSQHTSTPSRPRSPRRFSSPSTQPRMRIPKRIKYDKIEPILIQIGKEFKTLGGFLETLFYNRPWGHKDPRTKAHRLSVGAFLTGKSKFRVGHLILLLYNHRQSRPSSKSKYVAERDISFSSTISPSDIHHARPALSSWSAQLVGDVVHREIGRLTQDSPDDPDFHVQLRASTNGRAKNAHVITWDDLAKININGLASKLREQAPVSWFITEAMSAPRKRGVVVMRRR